MLSKKYYQAIAECIRNATSATEPNKVIKDNLIDYLCHRFKQDNSRFDESKFKNACKYY